MKKKVLFLQNTILHYRKPLYNFLSEYYDVTVLHSGKRSVTSEDNYNEIIVNNYKFKCFYFQKNVIKEIRENKYDVIIAMFDIAWINNIIAMFLAKKLNIKFIWWGIGFGRNKLSNYIRKFLVKKNKYIILYSKKYYKEFKKIPNTKVYIANNTFYIKNCMKSYLYDKKYFLFVGSLNKRKHLDLTLKIFKEILEEFSSKVDFFIIGDGEEKNKLINYVKKNNIEKNVKFLGKINDTEILKEYYKYAIASISYGQAGLSILQSFGCGVPFITKNNAISGGEITNIIHKYNGLLCNDLDDLKKYMILLVNDIEYAKWLGKNALNFYLKNCTMDNMVKNFIKAIED